tara:strand:- start:18910 stop:19443 length:534 start_codon:yes stop_codon:yes gene_type:complete
MSEEEEQETKYIAFEKKFHELGKTRPSEVHGLKETFLTYAFVRWPWKHQGPFAPKINELLHQLPTLSEDNQLRFFKKSIRETRSELRDHIIGTSARGIAKAEDNLSTVTNTLVELAERAETNDATTDDGASGSYQQPAVAYMRLGSEIHKKPGCNGEKINKKKRREKKKTRRRKKQR